MAIPYTDLYETIAEIMINEVDDARITQINRLEAEVADINVKLIAKQKEMEPLQRVKSDKEKQISRLRKDLARTQPQRAPAPAAQPKGAPATTAPSRAATPTTPVV